MTLTELRCLVAIVDAGLNVSAAGEALHMSQPGVSRHLKQVEESLGFQVFTRHGRQLVSITPAGVPVVEIARRVVGEVEGLRSYAANQRGDTSGELRIITPDTYSRYLLPPLLAMLVERHAGLTVRLQPIGEGERMRGIDRQHHDLLLVTATGGRMPEGNAIPLFDWNRRVLLPPGHVLAATSGPVSLAEMARWPLVTYESSRRSDSTLQAALASAGLEASFACSANDAGLIKAYVRAGLGVGLVSELALTEADRDHFVVRPADPALPACTAWAVLPDGQVLRDCVVELLELLAPQLKAAEIRRVAEGWQPTDWNTPEISLRH